MKKIISFYILQILFFTTNAQIKNTNLKSIPIINDSKSVLTLTKKMTSFNPAIHSFKFANTFEGVDASNRYGGLCGGMVYSQLDYYYAGIQIPHQNYAPSNRYPLQSYIYKRQAKSAQESNWDRWAELWFNPDGARTSEFFNWGISMQNTGDRMNELKAMIDQGKPVPLGLYHSDEAEKFGYYKGGDHQVLAIGYDFGKYKGDRGANLQDFKIYVADPNYPGKTMTLVADANARCFHYAELFNGKKEAWLTYFVNSKYEPFPPLIMNDPNANSTICIAITTGEDDLRGENDNLSIQISYSDGTSQNFANVNMGGRWISDYKEVVPLNLNRIISSKNDIKSIKLSCSFGGGINGDNWDFQKITISNMDRSAIYFEKTGSFDRNGRLLIKRFTGSEKDLTLIF